MHHDIAWHDVHWDLWSIKKKTFYRRNVWITKHKNLITKETSDRINDEHCSVAYMLVSNIHSVTEFICQSLIEMKFIGS